MLVAAKGARRVKKLRGQSRLEKLRLTAGKDPEAAAAILKGPQAEVPQAFADECLSLSGERRPGSGKFFGYFVKTL